jgi:tetratricopeptide (TPR) repeat protein
MPMKSIVLATLLALVPGGERERGLQLYREGRFVEAAAAFRAAIAADGDSAELQWNLALASWRAGELAAAETAAEKYMALDRAARPGLHAGLLGAVRHDEAKALQAQADAAAGQPPAAGGEPPADPLPLLEQAKQKAEAARDHFVRGAQAEPLPELQRNLERSLRTIADLERRIEELKKQREQQPKPDEQKPGDQEKPKDEPKSDDKQDDKQDGKQGEQPPKPDEQKPGEQKPDEQKPGEQPPQQQPGEGEEKPQPQQGDGKEPPEPKPQQGESKPQDGKQGEAQPEPKPGEQPPPEPKPGTPRQDAPGEAAEGRELTPEQAQRLLEQLRDLDDKQRAIRARSKSGRRPVERDW